MAKLTRLWECILGGLVLLIIISGINSYNTYALNKEVDTLNKEVSTLNKNITTISDQLEIDLAD